MKTIRIYQTGSALIVSLVLLLVLTVLSIAAMQGTTMQERMAGNFRETNAAFQAAEAALRVGEAYLESAVVGPFLPNTSACIDDASFVGLYQEINAEDYIDQYNDNYGEDPKFLQRWKDPDCAWIVVNTGNYEGRAPEYMIEEKPGYVGATGSLAADEPAPESSYYRVTARGFSASSGNTPVTILQSSYRRN